MGDSASFLLLLDMVPAAVIILSAAIAGLSADIAPNHIAWTVLEIVFTVFFVAEIIVKCRYFGICEYLVGSELSCQVRVCIFRGSLAFGGKSFGCPKVRIGTGAGLTSSASSWHLST